MQKKKQISPTKIAKELQMKDNVNTVNNKLKRNFQMHQRLLAVLSSKKKNCVFLTITLLILTVVVSCCFFIYSQKVKTILFNNAQDQLLEVSLQTRDTLQIKFQNAITSMHGYATSLSKYGEFNQKDVYEILIKESKRHKFSNMAVSIKGGDTYYQDGMKLNISDQPYFIKAMQGMSSVTEIVQSPRDEKSVIIYAVPIYDNNNIIGVLHAETDITQFEELYTITSYNKNLYTYVITDKGEVILRPQNPLIDIEYNNLFEYLQTNNNFIDNIQNDFNKRVSNVSIITTQNEKKNFIAYSPLSQMNGWYTISFTQQEPILKQSNYIFLLSLYLMGFVIFIVVLIFIYIYSTKRNTNKQFEYIANTDYVTSGRSWNKFKLDAEEVLKKCTDKKFAFIYTNFKNFKIINDILGFGVGNQLLRHMVGTLSNHLDKEEPFTRINADRFGILLEYTTDTGIIDRLEKINQSICEFQSLYKIHFEMQVEFGIYKIKDITLPISTISDRALLALQSLNAGDSNFGFYNSSIRQKVIMEKELENEMQSALENREFVVYLQPKFDVHTEEIIGAEALVRWLHPHRGLIPPNQFIELFERNGFIVKLDYFMFEETCKLLRNWIDNGNKPIPISVNVSRVHLYNPNVAEELYSITLRYDIPPELIEIELTEGMSYDNTSMLLGIVNRLKAFNFTISIDDFGAGYSSLNMLKDLPVDILKIDRDFFSKAADEKRGREVIASIIDMAKRLDM